MPERESRRGSNGFKTILIESVKLLLCIIELLIVVVGLFLLLKG